MDGSNFDNWVRKLARLQSRRDILKKGLGAAVAGGVLAGRGGFTRSAAAQVDATCAGADACTGTQACGLPGCSCATAVDGVTGVCRQTLNDCAAPVGCNSNAGCSGGQVCIEADCCTPTGFAGICTTPCVVPTTAPPTTAPPTTAPPTTAPPTTAPPTTAPPTTAPPTTAPPTTTTTTTKPPARATLDPTRGTVGSTVEYTLVGFPNNQVVDIVLLGSGGVSVSLGTVTTSATGTATGSFTVPAVRGGLKEIRFSGGGEVESANFDVAPRIQIIPATVQRGQTVSASLTGFGANEVVRIRWFVNGAYVQVGQVTTGLNGSATVNVVVPAGAAAGPNMVRGDGTAFAAQTNAVTVVVGTTTTTTTRAPATATLNPVRGTVNQAIDFTLANFPASATVNVVFQGTSGGPVNVGTVTTNASGAATGSFVVPATPGGTGSTVTFTSGATAVTRPFEVAPRIKVAAGARGSQVDVSLRGFARNDLVQIRWLVNGRYVTVGSVTTSNTGSANVNVTVPAGATVGNNTVRGDGTLSAQTNLAVVTA